MRALYNRLFGPSEGELIDLAFKRAAEAEAEVTKHAWKAAFYDALLRKIDHEADWWSYAQAMQNRYEARVERAICELRSNVARKRADTLIANYKGDAQ